MKHKAGEGPVKAGLSLTHLFDPHPSTRSPWGKDSSRSVACMVDSSLGRVGDIEE